MGWREHSAIQGSESAVRRSWASLGAPQPDTWLPHWGLCPAKKRSRQPHPHPREHACYFGRPPPLMYSGLATVGVPPAPAGGGGGAPFTSFAVRHRQCGQRKVMNVTPPGGLASTQRQRNRFLWAAPGLPPCPSQGCCRKPLVWGVWAFFFFQSFL